MHEFVFFNNQICLAEDVYLSGVSSIALYGTGIFTTIAIYNSTPFLWEKHWQRLTNNAERLGIDLSDFTEDSVRNSFLKIIKQNKIVNGRARLSFLDEKPSKIWSFSSNRKMSLLITTSDFREISEINLTVSPFQINSTSPLVNIKSCNYLENILALENLIKQGFNEAIRLNERGEIVSACLANIFWIKEGQIFTPSLETGCLAGTTRSFVLENFSVREIRANLTDLEECEAIFLTSSGIGVKKVKKFENKLFQSSILFSQLKTVFCDTLSNKAKHLS